MTYPSEFYYEESSSEKNYTRDPGHQISIDKLIAGKPYFVKMGVRALKPKTLIISDWRRKGYSYEYKEDLCRKIEKMLQEGFKFYLWNDEELTEITEETCHKLFQKMINDGLQPMDDHLLFDELKKHLPNIMQDQVFVLNDFWLDQLVSSGSYNSRILDLNTLEYASCRGQQMAIINYLMNSNPRLTKILPYGSNNYPELNSLDRIPDGENIELPFDFNPDNTLKNAGYTHTFYQNLSEYKDFIDLKTLFQSKNFVILRLVIRNFAEDICNYPFPSEADTAHIQELLLEGIESTSIHILSRLLIFTSNIFSHLKKVSLSNFEGEISPDLGKPFSSVETLSMNYGTININGLPTAFPNIKHLIMKRCKSFSGLLAESSLLQLERLHIAHCHNEFIYGFLKFPPPKLKFLILKKYLFDVKLLSSFKSLEKLIIQSEISWEDLQHLLTSLPHLKHINCKINNGHENEFSLSKESLNHLKYIKIETNEVSDNFFVLKQAASKAQIFIYDGFKYDDELDDESDDENKAEALPETTDTAMFLDAETGLIAGQETHLKKTFHALNGKEPVVNYYRKKVYNDYYLSEYPCPPNQAFTLFNTGNLDLIETNIPAFNTSLFTETPLQTCPMESEFQYVLGQETLNLSPKWQSIKSLHPAEEMMAYHCATTDLEIKYSKRDNLYYIRSAHSHFFVEFEFLLKVPQSQTALSAEVETLVETTRNIFKFQKPLSTGNSPQTGQQFLDALIREETGSCRHRIFVLKALMAQHFKDIPTRIIFNDCHAFVEIYWQNNWVSRCIGGYSEKLIVEDFKINPFNEAMKTWKTNVNSPRGLTEYCQSLLSPATEKKQLIELKSKGEIHALTNTLMQNCRKINRPVFYIDQPEDLICSAPVIVRTKRNNGLLKKGPGGMFYDFLQRNASLKPLILINYSKFKAADIVRFNSLLDKAQKVDGIPLPSDTQILGLINTESSDVYQGADFYSRFDKTEKCPLSPHVLKEAQPSLPFITEAAHAFRIDLYKNQDWKERLLGHWVLQGRRLQWQPGLLQKALKTSNVLNIHNGLWHNEDFLHFWQQACDQGFISHEGLHFKLPLDFKIIQTSGYDFKNLAGHIGFTGGETNLHVLSSGCLSTFLGDYVLRNHKIFKDPGLIEKNKGKTLDVYLTQTMPANEWTQLLSLCQNYAVTLNLKTAPSANLPEKLQDFCQKPEIFIPKSSKHTQLIISTDPSASLRYLNINDAICIDISECQKSDLLNSFEARFDSKTLRFHFHETKKALSIALQNGKTVILTGNFDHDLCDGLTPFLLARMMKETAQGQIILLTNEKMGFEWMPETQHEITPQMKLDLLSSLNLEIIVKLIPFADKPFCQLMARASNLQLFPEGTGEDAWAGIKTLSWPSTSSHVWQPKNSKFKARAFHEARRKTVNSILNSSPFVYLTGLTGVGKTTFVESLESNVQTRSKRQKIESDHWLNICQSDETRIFYGENALQNWAENSDPVRKILFIDEANMAARQWSEFEGLLQNPPGILINGRWHPLSQDHKVIFAGNPLSYGDERKLASFFERNGNAVAFEPLSCDVIYQDILLPAFRGTGLSEDQEYLSTKIIAVYSKFCQWSLHEVLISPRELQMMVLMISAYHQRHPDESLELVSDHMIYSIARPMVPKENVDAFEFAFKPRLPLAEPLPTQLGDYLVTPSRQPVIQQLSQMLQTQQWRRNHAEFDEQKYGGLNGLILEGESGVGKSEIVINYLIHAGYKEEQNYENPSKLQKPFYQMPVSMDLEVKEKLLRKAFDEGAVILIDEINSSPMMERLLNRLLTGKNPEGHRPKKPGFTIIGTQNPSSMAGRRNPSTALARRMTTLIVPEYSLSEVKTILATKGIEESKAELIAEAYIQNNEMAKNQNLNPRPTLRKCLKIAENLLQENEKLKAPAQHSFFYLSDVALLDGGSQDTCAIGSLHF